MNIKQRLKIITKLAQAQPTQPTTTTPTLAPPPAPPSDLFSYLNEGYNGPTAQLITGLTGQLNSALYYASQGKDNFQKIINNNLDLSGAAPDNKNVGMISQKFYNTFLNRKNPFTKKIDGSVIRNWSDTLLNSSEYNNLSQINPTGLLATKLQGNLKTIIQNYINQIKQQNPVSQ
jgi:hypothetical protein